MIILNEAATVDYKIPKGFKKVKKSGAGFLDISLDALPGTDYGFMSEPKKDCYIVLGYDKIEDIYVLYIDYMSSDDDNLKAEADFDQVGDTISASELAYTTIKGKSMDEEEFEIFMNKKIGRKAEEVTVY